MSYSTIITKYVRFELTTGLIEQNSYSILLQENNEVYLCKFDIKVLLRFNTCDQRACQTNVRREVVVCDRYATPSFPQCDIDLKKVCVCFFMVVFLLWWS